MNPFPMYIKACKVMVFVDGENLAIRYGKMLDSKSPPIHVAYEKDIFVWSPRLKLSHHGDCDTIRRHYYTAVTGDDQKRNSIHQRLKETGIEAPRVFQKTKERGSKRVDISLAVEMLGHAHKGNYDVAVLVAGDEDYVPLVEAVISEGRRVILWFVENGLSLVLKKEVDYFFDLGTVLMEHDANKLDNFGFIDIKGS